MRLDPFTLTGRHVQLQPLAPHHAPALLAAANRDRGTFGHTVVPADLPSMQAYIDGLLADAQRDAAVPFAQVRVADGEPVGCTRFMNVVWWPERCTPVEVEVGGTWLATDAQRSPLNTEAKLLLLTQAFERWQVFRVAICTDARNQQSRRAIERIGATLEGVLRNHRPSAGDLGAPGRPRDTAAYSIIDSEWPAVRERLQERLGG
ncbi:MAG: GNAT family protein [Actinomycetota bacterium]|nr:GNAT family protein [Actinomycetota bacterium]